ncbi:hypothetical protein CP10743SC13_0676 [Chlamydia psittaci 10_743_SC13]|nr:hypothetical protein CP10743SC13_0676 [Chlamydia psittaci 10_743_SC13]
MNFFDKDSFFIKIIFNSIQLVCDFQFKFNDKSFSIEKFLVLRILKK